MLKILIDADMPRAVKNVLSELNIDAVDVRDIGLGDASDKEIFEYAQRNKRILISRDLGFADISKYPLGSHYGIVVFRLPAFFIRKQILQVAQKFFKTVDHKKLKQALTIVEAGRYRIRKKLNTQNPNAK